MRGVINASVVDGINGDEALGALMSVLATMVAQVRDPLVRQLFIDTVVETFPAAVAYAAGESNALLALEEGTRQ